MKTCNILITSAGTASAVGVIKSLRKQHELKLRLFAVDADKLAPGLYLADKFHTVSKVSSPGYIDELNEIIAKEEIDVLLPIYSKEIQVIADNRNRLKTGVKLFIPPGDTVKLCDHKRLMNVFAENLNIKIPKIYTLDELNKTGEKALPLFIKPNISSGTRGAMKIDNLSDLQYHMNKGEDLIIQEFAEGEEVTVDVFCNKNSEAVVISPRFRLVTRSGQTIKGKTIENDMFVEPVKKLCAALNMLGVCNVQFMVNEGQLTLIEVNPRFAAGGLMLTVEAGANIPLLVVKEALGLPISKSECIVKTGLYMSRYSSEIFFNLNGKS